MLLRVFMFFPLVFLSGKANNQIPPSAPKENVLQELKKDSRELKESTDDLVKAMPLESQKPKVVYRIKKVYVVKEVLPDEHKILLNIGGDQYEADPTFYKGYILINVDSIQKAIVEQEAEEAMYRNDTLTQAIIEEADERINLWQKVKSIFKRKK